MVRRRRLVAPAVLLAGIAAVAVAVVAAPGDDVIYLRPAAAGPTAVPAGAAEEAAAAAVEAKLAAVVKEVRVGAMPLQPALDAMAAQAGVNLFVDWKSLEAAGIDREAKVTVALKDASVAESLEMALREVSTPTAYLGYEVRRNVVWVSTQENLSRRTTTRLYDVADVVLAERARWRTLHPPRPRPPEPVAPPPVPPGSYFGPANDSEPVEPASEELLQGVIQVIMSGVGPDTWRDNGGQTGTIKEFNGRLIVEQTRANHQRIAVMLAALRATARPSTGPVTIDVGAAN